MPDISLDYRTLFHQLPDNYLVMNPDASLLDNSDAHVRVSLLPREQAMGRHIFDAYPGDPQGQADLLVSHETVRCTLQAHIMPLLRYDIARPAALGGGTEERYWQITHFPLLDEHGALQFILQQSQDVTDTTLTARRAAGVQRELDEANDRNQFILQSLPLMVWTTRPDGSADSFNATWTNFTGRSLANTLGWGWVEDLHPDDLPRTTALWQAALDQGTSYQVEYRMRRHDGSYRWHQTKGLPRLRADGQIQMWVGCNTDIHEQKLMVEELLETNEQQAALSDQAYQQFRIAENQRETYHDLFMQAPAAITILRGPTHRHEFVNPPYQHLFSDQPLLGRPVIEVMPEIGEQGFLALLDNVYVTGETYIGTEMPVRLPGVSQDSYFNFTYQQFCEDGQPAGIMVFAFDVSDLVRARQELEKLRATDSTAGQDLA